MCHCSNKAQYSIYKWSTHIYFNNPHKSPIERKILYFPEHFSDMFKSYIVQLESKGEKSKVEKRRNQEPYICDFYAPVFIVQGHLMIVNCEMTA